jgi:hypothetical protein
VDFPTAGGVRRVDVSEQLAHLYDFLVGCIGREFKGLVSNGISICMYLRKRDLSSFTRTFESPRGSCPGAKYQANYPSK